MQAELLRSGELRQVIETMKPGISGAYTEKDVSEIGMILSLRGCFLWQAL